MRRMTSFLAVLALSLFATVPVFAYSAAADMANAPRHSREGGNPEIDPAAQARINSNYGKIPLAFEVNKGQTDGQVDFLSRGAGYSLFLSSTEAVMVLNARKPETADGKQEKEGNFPLAKGDRGGLVSDPSVLRMSLANANKHPKLVGEEIQPGTSNYFTGNDPEKWRTRVANYGKVRYTGVYDGIDLVYYGNQRKLEYDFIVQPGADYKRIRLNIQGADNVSIDDNGNLVLHMKDGDVVQHKPVVYQTENAINREDAEESVTAEARKATPPGLPLSGEEMIFPPDKGGLRDRPPTGKYVILANAGGTVCLECGDASPPLQSADESAHSKTKTGAASGAPTGTLVGFEIENYDPAKPLVIDPVLSYSTYLGGGSGDEGRGIAVDSSGNSYIVGDTYSTNFPITEFAYQTALSVYPDAFVTKLNSTGTAIIYSTYLGGGNIDIGRGIAVDSSGNAYVTGETWSTNFPTTAGAYQTASGGNKDVFVTKLNSTGTALVYSTYLGGSDYDYGHGIAVDSSGNAYITGGAQSTNFPTTAGAYQASGGGLDVFVSKLNSTGTSLVYSTYLGGSGSGQNESGYGIALDSSGNAYITGYASSTNFPTTAGAYQTAYAGGSGSDAFVTKLNSTGTALAYSTYLGGSGTDYSLGIAVDSSGNAYITGLTQSTNFPTTAGAYQTASGGSGDAFVTKLNSTGTTLTYSTYLGGSGFDYGLGIAVDSSGNACIAGDAYSTNFPTTTDARQTASGGGIDDAFVTKLNSTGTTLTYSTYLGGSDQDYGNAIALDSSGNAYITGVTISTNFPTTAGAYQTAHASGAGGDAFVTKLNFSATTLNATSTSVTSSLNPSTSGALVTFTASVSGSGGTPTGTVTFKDGSTTLGTGALSGGQATYGASSLSAGTHSITAVYGGDSSFASSTSSALSQTVTAVNSTTTTTSTSIASSLNPSTAGAWVTFTASVTGGFLPPTGSVTFKDGSTTLGTGALSGGQATYSTSSLSSMVTHSITAVYGGDTNFAASTSSALTQTVTTVTSGANGYSGTYSGQGLTIHLAQSGSTLSGTFSAPGGLTGNMGGFVDSSNRAYAWAWWDSSSSGSGVLAGNLPVSGNQTAFGFGGGQSSGGRIGQIVLNGLTQGSLSGSTTISTGGSSSANYAGTYTTTGLTITLTQSSSTLSGTFSAPGGLTGNMGGFVDSSGRAYVWAYWNSSSSGSGVAAGKLTVTTRSTTTPTTPTTNLPTASDTSQATFSFGGGQSSSGIIGEIVLSDMTLQ